VSLRIATLGSHSSLQIMHGAKLEGFKTCLIYEKRRRFYRDFHFIDEYYPYDSVEEVVDILNGLGDCVVIPHGSFVEYLGIGNIGRIKVPIFGNRKLMNWESDQKLKMGLLEASGIKIPKSFSRPEAVDRPVIVKVPEAKRKVERGFFIAVSYEDYKRKVGELMKEGLIDEEGLKGMVIEELVIGAHFNVNYFNSPVFERVEVISVDRRIQSDLDGFIRLPASVQLQLSRQPRLIEVGHEVATIRESLLEKVFEIGYSFVEASKELEPPGIIGPFTLQLMATPELELVVFDVAPRIGGGTNVYMGIGSQYSKLYFGKPVSLGRRIAIELKEADGQDQLNKILS